MFLVYTITICKITVQPIAFNVPKDMMQQFFHKCWHFCR